MTIQKQNIFYGLFLILMFLSVIVSIAAGIYVLLPELIPQFMSPHAGVLDRYVTLFQTVNLTRLVLSSGACSLIAFCGSVLFFRFFKHINNPQVFFLFIFFITLSFEVIKPLSLVLQLFNVPTIITLTLSRWILMSYFIGMLSMFLNSLYQLGMRHQNKELVLALVVVLSGFIAGVVPINTQVLSANFLHLPTNLDELIWVLYGIIIITILGYIFPKPYGVRGMIRGLSTVILIVGYSFIHFSVGILLSISGLTMVLGAVVLYFLSLFQDFFWY